MSKNEVCESYEVKGLDETECEREIIVKVSDTPITNTKFYDNNLYRIPLQTGENGSKNISASGGSKYIKGEFKVGKKAIQYSKLLNQMYTDDNESGVYELYNDQIDAESFAWFLNFTELFKSPEEHYNPPKPAEPEILKGFTKTIKGRPHYNEREVEFYTILGDNKPLLIKLLKTCNYLDCPILMHNVAYVLASYIRRTPALDIIKHFKETGLLAKDAKITNDGCEDCDDEPIPEDH